MILKPEDDRYRGCVSSTEYRFSGRPPGSDDDEGNVTLGSVRGARVPAPPAPLPPAPLDEEFEPELDLELAIDPAMTRAVTEPMPPELLRMAVARAVGTEPPASRPRIPIPERAALPATAAEDGPARMASFGTTTLLIVPAGDRVALVIPGVVRLTGSRQEVEALVAALRAAGVGDGR